jgi:hypothetical protein
MATLSNCKCQIELATAVTTMTTMRRSKHLPIQVREILSVSGCAALRTLAAFSVS